MKFIQLSVYKHQWKQSKRTSVQIHLNSMSINMLMYVFVFHNKYLSYFFLIFMLQEFRETTRRSILESTLKENELLHQTQLRRIVSTYLVHYGYCATAEQFNKNTENVYADELNSMRNRQCIEFENDKKRRKVRVIVCFLFQ